MSQAIHGGGGIPRKGHEASYATELWLDGPSAFWLHPEGPLSETTPDEWQAKQPPEPPTIRYAGAGHSAAGLMQAQNPYTNAGLLRQCADYQRALMNVTPGQFIPVSNGLAGLLGIR